MTLRDLFRNSLLTIRNLLRSLRRKGLDYVVLNLRGAYPERTPRQDPLPFPLNLLPLLPSEASLEKMKVVLERLGDDRRVRGVIVRFDALQAGPSALYSLRRMLLELRAKGKHVIAWAPSPDTWEYYLASACDEIILPPSGRLSALGLRSEALFLKETLALAGVEADLEAIAEYKVSPDTFRRSAMTEPHREMLDAILDGYFDEILSAVAEGRGLDQNRIRELIDTMPLTPGEAVEAGLVDAVLYEDELAAHLSGASSEEDEITLLTWQEAARWLRRPARWTTRQRIGVVSLEGMIVPGHSRRVPSPLPLPLPFEAQAGSKTITRALRRAEADEHIAAVIFHVETPGGSALASDLICREVRRLRKRKPVVVLMGGQAASGGYYVSALADRIVARPTTLTGSIGVWGGKFVLADLYDRLGVGRKVMQRGAMADLHSEMTSFSEEERALIRRDMGENYARFKAHVAEGREMSEEQVEEIARGRVWTGVQALDVGLVDTLGDFETALAAAKELAALEPERDYTVVQITSPRQALLPRPFPAAESAWATIPDALQNLARERVWALAPWLVRVQG